MESSNASRKKAFGLIEVIIGLAIIGGVLITATMVTVSASRQMKNNELSDEANQIMIDPIELLKAPIVSASTQPGKLLNSLLEGTSGAYSVSGTVDDWNGIDFAFQGNDTSPLSNCNTTSTYKVHFSDTQNQFNICLKIVVQHLNNNGFYFNSYIYYRDMNGSPNLSSFIGYRQSL